MGYFFWILIFSFGAVVGSFVLVIANRYNTGLPFFKGRSICFSCNARLENKELFPILSFIFLKGRCRHCGSKIPKETFVIEILMGSLSLLAFLKSGLSLSDFSLLLTTNYLLLTSIFATILLISIYDLKHFIIPDSFLICFLIFSFSYIILNTYPIIQFFISSIVLTLPFLLIFLISKGRWIGFGDIKYILVLGFFLGLSQGLSAVILSFWIGAAFSIMAISAKKLKSHIGLPSSLNNLTIKSEIPFGPFLSLGIIISFYLNADLFHINEIFNIF